MRSIFLSIFISAIFFSYAEKFAARADENGPATSETWGADDDKRFDPAKSFTVIVVARDSILYDTIRPAECVVENLTPYQNWEADVKTTYGDESGVITITFRNRPKKSERYTLTISQDDEGYRTRVLPIEIPENAKSPYKMPDVLMWGPGRSAIKCIMAPKEI